MPINRFYIPSIQNQTILTGDEHHHLSRVMRLVAGEQVELVDGKGTLAEAKVEEVKKQETVLLVTSRHHYAAPSPAIALAVPFMRPSKLEWVIEKGTELGSDAFLFYPADRSEKDELSEKQLERMRNLSIAAMKQSGRLYLPEFEVLSHLSGVLKTEGIILFGDTNSNAPWIEKALGPVLFVSGPEGGFSEKEREILEHKAKGVKISSNILRAETAPIAALAILKMFF